MDPVALKNHVLHQNIQALILDEIGSVVSSDDTLIQIDKGTSIINDDGVFIGLHELIDELGVEEEFKLDCIEAEFQGRHSIYDFLIKRVKDENSKKRYLLLLYDLEDVYRKVIDLRRERNEVSIYADKLAAAHAKLKETQLQLVSSEKMATVGLLAAGMTHEINNPLNYIFNGVELMKRSFEETKDISKAVEMSVIIEEGAKRIQGVVDNLKIFDSSGPNEDKEIDVHAAIDQCLYLVKYRCKTRIQLIRNYTKDSLHLRCNPGKFYQAFFNLFNNAVTFTDDTHEPEVEITTSKTESKLFVYIKDNGVGISSDIQKKVFDPFFTTKKMGTGKGLGLSVAHKIIKDHGGDLSFTSKEGVGTTFCVEFPFD